MTNDPEYRPGAEKPPSDVPPLNDPKRRTFREPPVGGRYLIPALIGVVIVLGLIFWFGGLSQRFMTASDNTTTTTTIPKANPPAVQPNTQPPATQPPATNP
jgi:hypothetical protein